jgi:hypothetical protein
MDMPTDDTPAQAYLPRSAYTVPRVAADAKTKGNEKDLAKAHKNLKDSLRAQEDQLEDVQAKAAIFDSADTAEDDAIKNFELGLYGLVEKNRDDPRYQRYFAGGLREVTEAEPRKEEPKLVGQILSAMDEDKLKPELELVPLIDLHQPKIAAALDAVVTTEADLAKSEKALAYLQDMTIPANMAEWRKQYKKLDGVLTAIFATNPKRAERYFKPFRTRAAKKTVTPANPAPTPVVPPPATPPAAPTTG